LKSGKDPAKTSNKKKGSQSGAVKNEADEGESSEEDSDDSSNISSKTDVVEDDPNVASAQSSDVNQDATSSSTAPSGPTSLEVLLSQFSIFIA
jgi:hypothetical protein